MPVCHIKTASDSLAKVHVETCGNGEDIDQHQYNFYHNQDLEGEDNDAYPANHRHVADVEPDYPGHNCNNQCDLHSPFEIGFESRPKI